MNIVSVVFWMAGLAFSFGIGLSRMRGERLAGWAVAAGILVNLPGYLGEGGPGVVAGLFAFPVVFILLAHIGRGIRWILVRTGRLSDEPRSGDRV